MIKGDNDTTVTAATGASIMSLLTASKFIGMALTWMGIPATPENAVMLAGAISAVATHLYLWFTHTYSPKA